MRPGYPCSHLLVLSLLLLTLPVAAAGQRRTALVLGNAAYETGPLRNPANDATDMAATLRRLGFDVTLLYDADRRAMQEAIDAFSRQLRQGGVGLFYFAGHGVQVAGENYLVPLRARINREQDVQYEAVPVGRILGGMEDADNQLNIIILDACRDNPFARRFRSSRRGLAPVEQAARGSLIAYATAPGAVSIDGEGRNGLYTSYLLQYITTPGLSVEQVFKHVRVAVQNASGGQQVPWELSSLVGDFSFVPEPSAPSPPAAASAVSPGSDPETLMWAMAEQSTHAEDLQAFLKAYPNSRYAPVARLKLQQLQRQAGQPAGPPSTVSEGQGQPPTAPPSQVARLEPTLPQRAKQVGRFIVYDNGTALDTTTNLMWMTRDFRNIEGKVPDNWHEAMAWVHKMNQQRYGGYSDWRVPTPEEYKAVYHAGKPKRSFEGTPVGYPEAFEDRGGVWYWSAEEVEVTTFLPQRRVWGEPEKEAYGFNFRTGQLSPRAKTMVLGGDSIRLVRRGP